jgi:hemolysin III
VETSAEAPAVPEAEPPSIPMVLADVLYPRLRGVSHAVAFFFAAGAALWALILAPAGRATVATAIYVTGLVMLFGGSGLYHRWSGRPHFKLMLQRIDHSMIFVFIAATYTPIALIVLHGVLTWVILGIAWAGAAAGVTLSLGWIDAPRHVKTGSYLALGWVALLALPEMLARLDPRALALLAGGGLLYSVGAVIFTRQRPDPWPRWFGFHEIFHACVIVAAAAQYIAIVAWVLPLASS